MALDAFISATHTHHIVNSRARWMITMNYWRVLRTKVLSARGRGKCLLEPWIWNHVGIGHKHSLTLRTREQLTILNPAIVPSPHFFLHLDPSPSAGTGNIPDIFYHPKHLLPLLRLQLNHAAYYHLGLTIPSPGLHKVYERRDRLYGGRPELQIVWRALPAILVLRKSVCPCFLCFFMWSHKSVSFPRRERGGRVSATFMPCHLSPSHVSCIYPPKLSNTETKE